MTSRKKPGVAFWATVVMVLPVLYVLSFGPAVWIASHKEDQQSLSLNSCYLPVAWVLWHAPRPISNALQSYARIGMKNPSAVLLQYGPPPEGLLLFSSSK